MCSLGGLEPAFWVGSWPSNVTGLPASSHCIAGKGKMQLSTWAHHLAELPRREALPSWVCWRVREARPGERFSLTPDSLLLLPSLMSPLVGPRGEVEAQEQVNLPACASHPASEADLLGGPWKRPPGSSFGPACHSLRRVTMLLWRKLLSSHNSPCFLKVILQESQLFSPQPGSPGIADVLGGSVSCVFTASL